MPLSPGINPDVISHLFLIAFLQEHARSLYFDIRRRFDFDNRNLSKLVSSAANDDEATIILTILPFPAPLKLTAIMANDKLYTFLTGSNTSSISTLAFDSSAGTLSIVESSPFEPTNPSWVATHPHNKKLVLATAEVAGEGQIATLLYDDKSRKASVVSVKPTSGPEPAHAAFSTDGKWIFVVNVRGNGDFSRSFF
jgi:hypothetical protein